MSECPACGETYIRKRAVGTGVDITTADIVAYVHEEETNEHGAPTEFIDECRVRTDEEGDRDE